MDSMNFGNLLDLDRGQHHDDDDGGLTPATSVTGGAPTTVIVSSSNNSSSTLSDLSSVTTTSYQSHRQHEPTPPDNDDMHATSSAHHHGHHQHHSPANGFDNMISGYGYCNTGPYETFYPQTFTLPPYTGKSVARRTRPCGFSFFGHKHPTLSPRFSVIIEIARQTVNRRGRTRQSIITRLRTVLRNSAVHARN
ncbi:Hypothetical protein CINCED_3A002978 [Cinara cedri]|uniref:Uncharacterized protein n=1 Tax=Cinara cedri TaxID=506608 RepID=A0A5E4N0K4_9HEMI|nr:Hypothetical protein CINCED_3A002978 [Cinara cedri]